MRNRNKAESKMQMSDVERMANDVDWLAFCYVANELPADEREAFEGRLADDQAIREAVARAVELVQAVSLAETYERERPRPASIPRRTTWPRRLAWMSVGASAALVLVAAALQWQTISRSFAPPPPGRDRLAEVWSQTRDEVRQIVQTEPMELPQVTEIDFSADESLPSWITAAVFNESGVDSELDRRSTHDES
jgi:anti-sigma factor RsiW